MALIVEDGTGMAGAEAYVSVADADTYISRSASAAAWAAKTTPEKEALIVQGARLLDAVPWTGYKAVLNQPMAWPRVAVPYAGVFGAAFPARPGFWPEGSIPVEVKNANSELARLCIEGDRSADVEGAGMKSVKVGQGALEVEFDATTRATLLGRVVPVMLADFVQGTGGKGTVRLQRIA